MSGTDNAELLNELIAHDAPTRCVCVGPLTGQALATGGDDCALHVWRLGRPTVVMTSRDFKRAVTAVAFGPAEGHLAAGSEGGLVKIISLSSQKVRALFPTAHSARVSALAWHPKGERYLASGGGDCRVQLLDAGAGTIVNTYTQEKAARSTAPPHGAPPAAPPAPITVLAFSPPGSWLAVGDSTGRVTIWDLKEGRALAQWEGAGTGGPAHRSAVLAFAWHPSELVLASGGGDGTVRVWSLERAASGGGGELKATTPTDARAVKVIAWTSAGSLIVVNDVGARAWVIPVLLGEMGQPITSAVTFGDWKGASAAWFGGQKGSENLVVASIDGKVLRAHALNAAGLIGNGIELQQQQQQPPLRRRAEVKEADAEEEEAAAAAATLALATANKIAAATAAANAALVLAKKASAAKIAAAENEFIVNKAKNQLHTLSAVYVEDDDLGQNESGGGGGGGDTSDYAVDNVAVGSARASPVPNNSESVTMIAAAVGLGLYEEGKGSHESGEEEVVSARGGVVVNAARVSGSGALGAAALASALAAVGAVQASVAALGRPTGGGGGGGGNRSVSAPVPALSLPPAMPLQTHLLTPPLLPTPIIQPPPPVSTRLAGDFVPAIRDVPVGLSAASFLPEAVASGFGSSRREPLLPPHIILSPPISLLPTRSTTTSSTTPTSSTATATAAATANTPHTTTSNQNRILSSPPQRAPPAGGRGRREHEAVMTALRDRRESIREIARKWKAGDVRTSLETATSARDPGVRTDVLCEIVGVVRGEETGSGLGGGPPACPTLRITPCATSGAGTGALEMLRLGLGDAVGVLSAARASLENAGGGGGVRTAPAAALSAVVGLFTASAVLRAFAPALKSAWITVVPRGMPAPAVADGDAGAVLATALTSSASLITLDPASEDRASRAASVLTLLSALRILSDAVQAGGKNFGPTAELSTSLIAAARGFAIAHDANLASLCK